MKRLLNKVAIITGGSRGIGKAIARLFSHEGAKVIIWDLDQNGGESLVQELVSSGGEALFQLVNTSNHEACDQAAKEVQETYGSIDILINNAGITRDARLIKMTRSQWQDVLDVNLTGVFNCTQSVAPYMIQQGSGKIVSASSVVGVYGNFGQTNYVATKSAVIGMTKVWSRELGPKGINVNAIAPGFIATEMIETIPEKVIQDIEAKTPLRRFGKPEEVAEAYLFLSSEAASFINGETLNVNGGITI
ncbi:MAG: 3-oxoacyl-ACP reductase FabG [Bacteroidia bacterium]|nr:3-oxoacyl-ACP reductase FabG [Bacteroidia bacterium]